MTTATHQEKMAPVTSGWAAIIFQLIIMVFYGGGLMFTINQNSDGLETLTTAAIDLRNTSEETATRVKVIETKMEYYDKIIDKMDTVSENIQELRIQVNDLQHKQER